ncbi:hypothetical protein [uncultured Legionella sp.]|uniref:hypothetical protein n=1 Tax=uncultured Legionella sp. TaxID=210934 RepID=UPI00261320C4|nr:hypothetical protein [uncultured Legionella sp.]
MEHSIRKKIQTFMIALLGMFFFGSLYEIDLFLNNYPAVQFYLYLIITLLISPFYIYLIVRTVCHYYSWVSKLFNSFFMKPLVFITGSLLYTFANALTSQLIQSIFYLPSSSFPATVFFLSFVLSLSAGLFLVGLLLYALYIPMQIHKKEFQLRALGVHAISLLCIISGWICIHKLITEDTLIKKLALYFDYKDMDSLSLTCEKLPAHSKILFLDSEWVSIVYKDSFNKRVKLSTLNCA